MRLVVMIALAMTLTACGKPAAAPSAPPPEVRIAQVGGVTNGAVVVGVGTVAVRREVSLGFTSAGRIARLTVNEGERVRAGQLLASLDTTIVSADAARANAEYSRAAAEYRRSVTLMKQGWITRARLDNAQAAMVAAQAQSRSTGFQTSNARILAPGNGVVLARLAEPGQVVPVGTPVLIVGEEGSGYVLRVPLSDRDVTRLSIGAPARIALAALGGQPLSGQIVELAGRADRSTGTFTAEIALPDDGRLRSGQIGDAHITAAGTGQATLAVPPASLFAPRAGEGFVYVVDPATGRVRLRKVTVGETGDDNVRILSGLSAGEWVATSRIDRLKDGMKVTPIRPAR